MSLLILYIWSVFLCVVLGCLYIALFAKTDGRFVRKLFLGAFFLRLSMGIVLEYTGTMIGDEATYDMTGQALATLFPSVSGQDRNIVTYPVTITLRGQETRMSVPSWNLAYALHHLVTGQDLTLLANWIHGPAIFYLHALIYSIFGYTPFLIRTIAILLTSCVPIFVYRICLRVFEYRRDIARSAAWLAVWFPPIVYYSATHLKEPYTMFLLAWIICIIVEKGFKGLFSISFLFAFILILSFRGSFAQFLILALLLEGVRKILSVHNLISGRLVSLFLLYVGIACAFAANEYLSFAFGSVLGGDLTRAIGSDNSFYRFLIPNSGSFSVVSLKGLWFVGIVAFFSLLIPTPLIFTGIPDSVFDISFNLHAVLWYLFLPFLIYGIWRYFRQETPHYFFLIFIIVSTLGLGVAAFAGPGAERYRSCVLPFLVVFIPYTRKLLVDVINRHNFQILYFLYIAAGLHMVYMYAFLKFI